MPATAKTTPKTETTPKTSAAKPTAAKKAPTKKASSSKVAAPKTAPATKATSTKRPAQMVTAEEAMQAIGEFAREHGAGWREELRTRWQGDDDGSPLHAARDLIPDAILDNLTFKPARKAKPLTPEQEAARRLRAVGTALRANAKTLQTRARDIHETARKLRKTGTPKEVAAIMREMLDDGGLAALEAEVGISS